MRAQRSLSQGVSTDRDSSNPTQVIADVWTGTFFEPGLSILRRLGERWESAAEPARHGELFWAGRIQWLTLSISLGAQRAHRIRAGGSPSR
jgi:hypothetical protein